MNMREWSMIGALALMWGSAFMFTKLALAGADPMEIAATRSVIGLLMLAAIAWLLSRRARGELKLPPWGLTIWLGLSGAALPFVLMSWGQQHIDSALAGILVSAVPVFTVLAGHFIEGETKIGLSSLGGAIVGLAGVALVIGPEALAGLTDAFIGQLAILAAALGYATAALIGRRIAGYPPVYLGIGQMVVSTIVIVPAYFLVEGFHLPDIAPASWFWITALALVASALPPILMFRLLRTVTATQLSLVSYLVPVVALLWGILLFGERLHPGQFAGFALIMVSLWAINRGRR
jgi:drug/metabolite transporter (DMT)-like permease